MFTDLRMIFIRLRSLNAPGEEEGVEAPPRRVPGEEPPLAPLLRLSGVQ